MARSIREFIEEIDRDIERNLVVSAPSQSEIPGMAVLDKTGLHKMLDRYLGTFPAGTDRRGVASMWSTFYFNTFAETIAAAALVVDLWFPVGLDAVSLIPRQDNCNIAAIRIPHAGLPIRGDVFERLHTLVREHLDPLIRSLSAWARMSPKAYWCLVGNNLDWLLRDIATLPEMPADRIADFNRILTERCWPDGWRNPLYEPIRYVASPDGPRRERRVCCLRYLLPDDDFCGNCPMGGRGRVPTKDLSGIGNIEKRNVSTKATSVLL